MTLRMRLATEDDWQDILDADRLCFPEDAPPVMGPDTWWLLEDGEELAGYCSVRCAADFGGAGVAYLSRSGVMPEYRGQGLQRRLVRVRERWARRNGFLQCVSDTYSNPASANTLISCGYKMWEMEKPWGRFGTCYWVKTL